jgi:hypothetical protein
MASHGGLAREYAHILLSYAREDGNYLEHEGLQRGLLWGVSRLSEKRPELVRDAAGLFLPYLTSGDEVIRGLAARLMGLLRVKEARPLLQDLSQDESPISLGIENPLTMTRVKDLAEEALRAIG